MFVNLIYLFVLSSGSAFASTYYGKNYIDVLPVTASCIVLIQFLFGILGYLEFGFLFAFGICFTLWLFALIKILKVKNYNALMRAFFSKEFWMFIVIYVGLNFLLVGMQAHEWDEFSHWATVVKAMVQEGCLAYHPKAHLTFGNYPPAMALFQYFLQKIYIICGNGEFSEWRLYLSYIVLVFTFLLPLIKKIKTKNFRDVCAIMLVFILLPLPFYENYYHSLYIDAFLGVLLGCGLTMIVLERDKKNICYSMYIYSLCFMLAMAKLSGVLFSFMIILAYIFDLCKQKNEFKKVGSCIVLFFILVASPLILWNHFVKYFQAQTLVHRKIYPEALGGILTGKDTTYRKEVFNSFKLSLFDNTIVGGSPRFSVGNLGFSINYFALLIFFVLLSCLICSFLRKRFQEMYRSAVIVMVTLAVIWAIFYISLGITYLFRFDEDTSMKLASYSRYIHEVYLPIWLLLVTLVFWSVYEFCPQSNISILCLCGILLITPVKDMVGLLFKDQVSASIENRQKYTELVAKIHNYTKPNSKIYFICQNDTYHISGAAYWQISFEVRPAITQDSLAGWMFGPESVNGVILDLNASEWKKLLLDEYDYVAIYEADQYFCETFSELFANPSKISNNNVYVVNKETGLLELCE